MTPLEKFVHRAKLRPRSSDQIDQICLDVGSHTTKLLLDGKIVRMYPTCFIRDTQTHQVLAIGQKVLQMLGKLPANVSVVFPVRNGQIVESEGYTQLVKAILQEFTKDNIWSLLRPVSLRGALLYPQYQTQQTVMSKALRQVSYRSSILPMAETLWQAVRASHVYTTQGCIIDIGGMTTKFYLFAEGQLAGSKILDFGGDAWTTEVIQSLRQQSHLDVGWVTAEALKVAAVRFGSKEQKHTVHGKDIVTGLPTTKVISDQIFMAGANRLLKRVIQGFEEVCQEATPEIVAKILERGIYITGGSSQMKGLAAVLQQTLKLPVTLAKNPQDDVVRGLAVTEALKK